MILTNIRTARGATRAAALLLIVAISAPTIAANEPASDIDGLVRVDSRNLDHLYVLPAADFASYMRIRLDPVEVSFSERWDPNSNRSRGAQRRMTTDEIEGLRSSVAMQFEQILKDELRRGGYMFIQGNAPDALRVTPMIVNLYVTAPGAQQRPGTRVYVANTGHMTLVAEVSDSVTGEPLARVVDTQRGRRTGTLQLATTGSNMTDARRAFTDWARTLRAGLDDARQSPVAKEGVKEAATEPETQSR
jgi:hypothetical protein